jgi:hypothetical protein
LAAKSPAAKKAKVAKSTKTSKTTNASSQLTSVQRSAFRAAYNAAVKNAGHQQRANAIAAKRVQAAATRQKRRSRYVARTKANIVRNTYLQARYGNQTFSRYPGVPLRSRLSKVQSITAYLQARYGKKTYAITTNKGSVRVSRYHASKGKVVAAGRRAVSKPATNRSAIAKANAAAARVSHAAASKPRKAAGDTHTESTEWITAGNDKGEENCVAVAAANHLLYHTGYRVNDNQVTYLQVLCDNRLSVALDRLDYYEAWAPASLSEYGIVNPADAKPGMIVGFQTPNGDHCGLLMPGNKVVSWGEIVPLESEIEEAWEVIWVTG